MNLGIKTNNIPAIKDRAKQLAIDALSVSDYNSLLKYNFIHNHAEVMFSKDPCYRYSAIDEDFYTFIKRAAVSHPLKKWVDENRYANVYNLPCKLKVGIVLEGFSNTQAPIQRYRTLAKFHDKSRFDLYFYSRLAPDFRNFKSEGYDSVIEELRSNGCHVRFPSQTLYPIEEIEFLTREIVEDQIDILFFQTVYFVPQFNFVSCLHPTPFQAGGSHQQPEMSPELDCVDSPKSFLPYQVTDCIPLFSPMNMDANQPSHGRSDFGIPEDAVVLVSSNRGMKYGKASEGFWKGIEGVLNRHQNVYFIPLGLENVDFNHDRMLKLGFRQDAIRFYKMSDIYVDIWTHTSKGVMEAAYVGVPSMAFHREPPKIFSVLNQDLTTDWLPNTELIVNTPEQWHSVMDRLINDRGYRLMMGEGHRDFAQRFEPKVAVDSFLNTLEEKFWRKISGM